MMNKAVFCSLLFACCFTAFLKESAANCNRNHGGPVDCFTQEDDGCFVFSGGIPISDLEFPNINTRTCYRTCHDGSGQCQATLTNVHNRALNKDPDQPEYSLQTLFSPNFQNNIYRKSTICRYNVKCDGDKLLSYSFETHDLESRTNLCTNPNRPNYCVDYVKLDFPNFGQAADFTCGQEADTTLIQLDGLQELNVEFFTNRIIQEPGFNLFVWCSDPGFDINAQNEDALGRRKRSTRKECTLIPNDVRKTPDPIADLERNIPESRNMFASDPTYRIRITMNELDTLTYRDNTINIIRGRFSQNDGINNATFYRIRVLFVSNRLNLNRKFYSETNGTFKGFGEVWIDLEKRACFLLQQGVNPILRPTDKEASLILMLQHALIPFVQNDFFDVLDDLDIREAMDLGIDIPVQTVPREEALPKPDPTLSEMALKYGNACNGLLRSAACSYQRIILKKDCITGMAIKSSTDSPTVTEAPILSPVGYRWSRRPRKHYYPYRRNFGY